MGVDSSYEVTRMRMRTKKFFKVRSSVFWCPYSSSRIDAIEQLRALAMWLMVRIGRTV